MVSLVPLPLGSDNQGLVPSPMGKMLPILDKQFRITAISRLRNDLPGGEGTFKGVLDVDDIETTNVLLTVHNNTSTTHVTTTSDHDDNTSVEADEVGDLASGEVNLDGVVDLDGGVGVADEIGGRRVVIAKLADNVVGDFPPDFPSLVGLSS